MSLKINDLLKSPDYYPLKFEGENLVFVRMSRDSYAKSIFTGPNRIVTVSDETWSIPFSQIVELTESVEYPLESPACVFHIANCGSTLLSRALDHPGNSLVIREPFALRQIAAATHAPSDSPQRVNLRRNFVGLWRLLSRQYQSEEKVLIKTNVPVNYYLSELLSQSPDVTGILLYSKFEDYLVQVLKNSNRRQWAQRLVRELANNITDIPTFESLDIGNLDAAKATAVLWLSQMACYQAALKKYSSLVPLAADDFYSNPFETLNNTVEQLNLNVNDQQLENVVKSDVFTRHSKNPDRVFSEAVRSIQMQRLKLKLQHEIDQTTSWCIQSGFQDLINLNFK